MTAIIAILTPVNSTHLESPKDKKHVQFPSTMDNIWQHFRGFYWTFTSSPEKGAAPFVLATVKSLAAALGSLAGKNGWFQTVLISSFPRLGLIWIDLCIFLVEACGSRHENGEHVTKIGDVEDTTFSQRVRMFMARTFGASLKPFQHLRNPWNPWHSGFVLEIVMNKHWFWPCDNA